MILIADGGSTKADWIALDNDKNEVFRVRTLGLNPAVVNQNELRNRIVNMFQLMDVKEEVTEIHFYGAGCGTPKPSAILKSVLETVFIHAKVNIEEDMLAAVYAASGNKPAIVCILGTGSNSELFRWYFGAYENGFFRIFRDGRGKWELLWEITVKRILLWENAQKNRK